MSRCRYIENTIDRGNLRYEMGLTQTWGLSKSGISCHEPVISTRLFIAAILMIFLATEQKETLQERVFWEIGTSLVTHIWYHNLR
jgi:hypothetical protein